jgi:hypothetical protein
MRQNLATLTMGQLSDADVGLMINKALEETVEEWPWLSLFRTGVIWGIPDNTEGVVSLVNGSKIVTGQMTNFPTTFPDYCPPENWVIVMGSQYMPMEIESFNSATQLTLKEPWGDVTQSNVNFNLRPQFYSVPGGAEVYLVRQILPVLPMSRHMLSLVDPARLAGTSTPSVAFAEAGFDLKGNIRLELWLRPGGVECFVIEFRKRFSPLVSDNDWPEVPMNVLEQKALMYCYASLYASQGTPAWLNLMQAATKQYNDQFSKAIRDDIERQVSKYGQGYAPGYELWQQIDQAGPPGPAFMPKP